MNPIHIPVGTSVQVTLKTLEIIKNGNRSIHAFPCDSFVSKISCYIGRPAKVERQFLPGYEVNIQFDDGQIFQVKDHWVEIIR